MKNEQRAKLAKRAELPRVKLEYAPNCRAPIWHRVEVGRAEVDCVKLARVKKDVPNWTGIHRDAIESTTHTFYAGNFMDVCLDVYPLQQTGNICYHCFLQARFRRVPVTTHLYSSDHSGRNAAIPLAQWHATVTVEVASI